jgi:BlaI family transcriptional regulator, penicillinase repressor
MMMAAHLPRHRASRLDKEPAMSRSIYLQLSRREREIMDIVYHLDEATVAEVVARMPDQPGYNTVRNTMTILEKKGFLQHRQDGQRYVYTSTDPVDSVKSSAVTHLLDTFFNGSLSQAVQAVLGTPDRHVSRDDLDEIARLIEKAREKL